MSVYTKSLGDNGARLVFGPRMKHPVFLYGKCQRVFCDVPGDLSNVTVYKAGYDDGPCYVIIAKDVVLHVHIDTSNKHGEHFDICRLHGSYDEKVVEDFTAIGSETSPFPDVQ